MTRLDAIKARLNEVGSHHPDVVVLVAAVEAVLALHGSTLGANSGACAHCWDEWGEDVLYPCPTVTAIREALGEKQ